MGKRFEQMRNELGLTNTDLAQLTGLPSLTILSTWESREAKGELLNGVPGEGVIRFSTAWCLNPGWFLGDAGGDYRWSAELVTARHKLRKWAKTANYERARDRLVATWEKMSELMPVVYRDKSQETQASGIREEIWAAYLGWATCERAGRSSTLTAVAIHMGDWLSCKHGTLNPGPMQLRGAAMLTGLPEKWFHNGDEQLLRDADLEDAKYLLELIYARDIEIEDAVRIMETERLSPR